MHVYTLKQTKTIEHSILGQNINLNEDTLNKINKIATMVGAPTYVKTPQFEKKRKDNLRNKDWEMLRNFKQTKLEKKEGIEGRIDEIRFNLNKLTDKTYDSIYDIILNLIKEINDKESLEKVGEAIFDIGSDNKFWSQLYAKLYNSLINEFPIMKIICYKNFQTFKDILLNIRSVDPEEDYDLFCEINKENEKRKGLSKFLSICSTHSIINHTDMIDIIYGLITYLDINIDQEDRKNPMEEISENLFILIQNSIAFLDVTVREDIKTKLEYFANLNVKEHPSLSNKLVFKLMDIVEIIEDKE